MMIYTICLVFGLIFTLFSAFFGHLFGGGHDAVGTGGQADAGFGSDGVPGISFFSPTVLASFITSFGAVGLVCFQFDALKSFWINAPVAFIGGVLIASFTLWLMNKIFFKTQGSSEARVGQLIGTTASLASSIPENGVGEISYIFGGSRYSAPARAENGRAIASGRTVTITRIVGTQYFVEAAD